jgi:DNA-binding transcriptional LysR family regulator
MDEVRLSDVNLNLLVALEALVSEGSVTRAAARIGVSQSAMSHTLRQLRELFDDPLLVRGKGGMVPTPRAEAAVLPLRRGLGELRAALSKQAAFDPAQSRRTLRVAASDGVAVALVPGVLRILRREAPGVDLDVVPFERRTIVEQLDAAQVDLAIGVGFPSVSGLRTRKLLDEHFVCLVADDHPCVRERLSLEMWTKLPHALVGTGQGGPGVVDQALAEIGMSRRVALRVRSFLAAPLIVARSHLVLTLAAGLARPFLDVLPLRLFPPPIELPRFALRAVWHERYGHEPALAWFRGVVLRAAQELTEAPSTGAAG